MERLNINHNRCSLCGRCVSQCPVQALKIQNDEIHINSSCTMCGNCTKVCYQDAIRIENVSFKTRRDKDD